MLDLLNESDYEISFLRLLEKLTNGSQISISHTGTSVTFVPGLIHGGRIEHSCPTSRSIGYFLESIISLAPFSKSPFDIMFHGVTNSNVDSSVDTIRTVYLPLLKKFGIEDAELKIKKRGAMPLGGGEVHFSCSTVKALTPIIFTEEGKIKRIRGIAYATRISPQTANRVVENARKELMGYIPDVYIYTDVYKGPESGLSPGYALTLVAESTQGVLLSAETAYHPRATTDKKKKEDLTEEVEKHLKNVYAFETPEDLGERTAKLLLKEIGSGGCVTSCVQWLALLFCALCPEDVVKVRVGKLTPFSIQYLRDIKTFLGVKFQAEGSDDDTVLMTCLGSGYVNMSKKTN